MKKRLGKMLIEAGLLNQEQLDRALSEHRKANLKMGQFLIAERIITETDLVNIVSTQLNIEKYRPEAYPIDTSLASLIPSDVAQKHQMIPLKKKGTLLIVATTDPTDIQSIDIIESLTDCEIDPLICTEQEFNYLNTNLYGANTGISGLLDEMEYKSQSEEDEASPPPEYVEVSSLQDMAEEAPVVRLVNSILSQAVREGASDIHISPEKDYVQMRFRVDGKLHEVPAPPKHMILPIVSRLKILGNMDISVFRVPQDGRFTAKMSHKEINIRVSTIPTIYGENMVLRLLDATSTIYSLEELGMTENDRIKTESMLYKPYGMILSTGPTGSGKTTSLYSIIKTINDPDINIITLEDPVEYRLEKIRQIQLNRKAGMTFASGIRSVLRQDPDVIMIGEIRDTETAMIAVQAALTGHRVLSTLHTNNAGGTITRFIDMGVAPFLLSSVLLLLIAQRLVRQVCPYCSKPFVPSPTALKYWGIEPSPDMKFVQAKGCFNCLNTGYKGRTGVFEVMAVDEMVQDMILKNESANDITRAAQKSGKFKTLRENVAEKISRGITTFEEAASVVVV
ncbi:MAG: general secretion pathway protein GspE [Desulfobacteraceae bacterium IS3]|nr:MAG: general secretion pathway protein GspE [Desulfobacteraceae bacterium IS3]